MSVNLQSKSPSMGFIFNCLYDCRRDQSLTMIMSTLHRLETKLEDIPTSILSDLRSLRSQIRPPAQEPQTQLSPAFGGDGNQPLSMLPPMGDNFTPVAAGDGDDFEFEENQPKSDSAGRVSISFSQHGVIVWPGARQILPKQLLAAYEMLGKNYVIELESTRPPLPMFASPYPLQAGDHWLEVLPLAMIRGLADAFFSVFNPSTPIMDKGFFFSFTLGSAIESGFGFNLESCIVLNVLALGCLAVMAYQEGNYPLPGTQGHRFEPPEWINVVYEEQPGLRFFNEARRRIGFLMCDNDIQSCQFYLLSSYVSIPQADSYICRLILIFYSVYYSQIPRPMDSWTMISRAATCCLSMLTK